MKALKPGENETIQFHNQFTTCLLEMLENCRQDKKPVQKCILEALSKMMPLLGRAGLKRYAYILVFHFYSILIRASKSESATDKSNQISSLTMDLIGDLFTILKSDSAIYLKNTIKLLLDLKGISVQVRSHCVAALGKVAAAVGDNQFEPYLPAVLLFLHESSELTTTPIVLAHFYFNK
jgi:hypothetical protein